MPRIFQDRQPRLSAGPNSAKPSHGRRHLAWIARSVLAFAFAASATPALAECILYDDAQYQGQAYAIAAGQTVSRFGPGWNDRASSLRLTDQCELVAHLEERLTGGVRTFVVNASQLPVAWNNTISSAECQCANEQAISPARITPRQGASVRDIDDERPVVAALPRETEDRAGALIDDTPRTTRRPSVDDETQVAQRTDEAEDPALTQCMLYTGRRLQGASLPIGRDRQRSRIPEPLTRDISSLSVPSGCVMRVFDETQLRGRSTDFAAGLYNSLGVALDNRIGSAQCLCSAQAREDARPQRNAADAAERAAPAETLDVLPREPRSEPAQREARRMPQPLPRDADEERQPAGADDLADISEAACTIYTGANMTGTALAMFDGDFQELRGPGASTRIQAIAAGMSSIAVSQGCSVTLRSGQGDELRVRSDRASVAAFWPANAVSALCACETQATQQRPSSGAAEERVESIDDRATASANDRMVDDDEDDASSARLAALPAPLPERSCGIYSGRDFTGESLIIESDAAYSYIGGAVNDAVSSVRVAPNCQLELYENRDFNRNRSGFKAMFQADDTEIDRAFADRASSALCKCAAEDDLSNGRVERDASLADDDAMTVASQGSNAESARLATAEPEAVEVATTLSNVQQCVLFEHQDLKGDKISLAPNTALRWIGSRWADRASSALVSSGCSLTIFAQRDYAGNAKRVLQVGEHVTLGRRWSDRTRSAQCRCAVET